MENKKFDINELIQECLEKLQQEMKDMGHVNIIVAGKTGVGKSTLINGIFREKLADTGVGTPVTATLREYCKEGLPLRVYDTIGLELDHGKQEQVKTEIHNLIKSKLSTGEKDQFIHCIWYCINVEANRIETFEQDLINQLALDNKDFDVPVIVVLTMAYNKKKAQELRSSIESLNLHCKNIIPVLACDYEIENDDEPIIFRAYGGDLLVEFTSKIIPESAQKAFINAQRASIPLKKDKAHLIVAATATTAFGEGYIPIPFSDSLAIVPTQMAMIASITAVFGVPMDKAIMTTIVTTLLGAGGATIAGKTIVANLLKMIPGYGTVAGGAISGATAAALTVSLGEAYIIIMELMLRGELSVTDDNFEDRIKKIFKDTLSHKK